MRSHVGRPLALFLVIASSLMVIATAVPSAEAARQGPGGNAPCAPRIIDLGTLGGSESEIDGSNSKSTWVGSAQDASGMDIPVMWHNGLMQPVGISEGWAADVNNRGVVVGNEDPYAFWWSGGTQHLLPLPPGATGSYVRRINDHNDAAGSISYPDGSGAPV